MNRYNRSDKPDWVPPRSNRLLDQVRERVRYLHYSLQTEKACVYWAKAFVLWAARSGGFHSRYAASAFARSWYSSHAVPPHRRCSACRCSRALAGCLRMR